MGGFLLAQRPNSSFPFWGLLGPGLWTGTCPRACQLTNVGSRLLLEVRQNSIWVLASSMIGIPDGDPASQSEACGVLGPGQNCVTKDICGMGGRDHV